MLTVPKLIETFYYFLFGLPPAQIDSVVEEKESESFNAANPSLFDKLNNEGSTSFTKPSKVSELSLEFSRLNFAGKLKKSSHAINHPYQPRLNSPPIQDRVKKMQELIDSALNDEEDSSPSVKDAYTNREGYKSKEHRS